MIIGTLNPNGEVVDKYVVDISTVSGLDPLKTIYLAYQKKYPKKTYVDVTRVISYNPHRTETYRMYQGKPQADIPKSWKLQFSFNAEELSGRYNSGNIEVYKAKTSPILHYATYRDGCFYQYMGIIIKQ